MDAAGNPGWSRDILHKAAVLTDDRQLYTVMLDVKSRTCEDSHRVIAQGGVVYDAPLKRYLFASWSCATHEYYEAPHPWGPWRHFLVHRFRRAEDGKELRTIRHKHPVEIHQC